MPNVKFTTEQINDLLQMIDVSTFPGSNVEKVVAIKKALKDGLEKKDG